IRPHQEEPKLSVLTATYNHADYIAECIESVLAQQTDFPFQHIIADDGSNDGTQGIILNYATKYPHIVPVFQKKRSFGAGNLRALFDMARTEYVAICEGDDYFTDPAKLQTQVDFLEANPYCALCFHVVRVTHEGDPESDHLYPLAGSLPGGVRPFYYLTDLIRKNFFQTNSVMYRWRFKNGLPDWFRTDLMPGDLYWHLLHAETGKIGFIDKVMGVYRRHKKGVYYLAAVDKLKHRAKTGMKELEVFDVINKHFNRIYEPILLDVTDNIFADCAVYDETRAKQEGMEPVFTKICEKHPEMAWHFLQSMKNVPQ
ncbi:MAG: glycosyltransferase, partial [Syntrophorhabdaceae bacterium]|nr:glycosyltransferase [Syntrophorhabdaceae bacterium]